MAESTISITFESLMETIANLGQSEKRKLWEYLDAEFFEEEDLFNEMDEQTIADIKIARAEYAAGEYLTYDAYLAQRRAASV